MIVPKHYPAEHVSSSTCKYVADYDGFSPDKKVASMWFDFLDKPRDCSIPADVLDKDV